MNAINATKAVLTAKGIYINYGRSFSIIVLSLTKVLLQNL
jgi:hypothetical protein